MNPKNFFLITAALLAASLAQAQTPNPVVRFHTNLGDMDVTLRLDVAPLTVANFIKYVNKGSYTNSIFHRSVKNFVIQGGGFQLQNHAVIDTPQDASVHNEYNIPNTRGTLAMAKFGGDPNSATNQWFFNLSDNSTTLGPTNNGGYTVFGVVTDPASLAVMDKIGALQIINAATVNPAFDTLPVTNYSSGAVQESNYVLVNSVEQIVALPVPTITANGIVQASGFGAFPGGAPGSYLEIYGINFSGSTRGWAAEDFTSTPPTHAPTALDQVTVTVNGRPAFVNYISPGQVNIQLPDSFPRSGTYPVIVNYRGLPSEPYSLAINPVQPGLLAPATFKVGDKQFAVGVHQNGTLVANASIPGVPAAPAKPGETLSFYGTGWGAVTNTSPIAGIINSGSSTLDGTVEFDFGSAQGQVSYAGLAPGLVGVDQFNIVVPQNAPDGDIPLRVLFKGVQIPQTLYITVQH